MSSVRWHPSFILLHVRFQFSQHLYCRDLPISLVWFLALLSTVGYPYTCGLISGLSVPSHVSACLVWCQSQPAFIVVVLQDGVKSRSVIPQALFFLLGSAFTLQGLLWFHPNLKISVIVVLFLWKKRHWHFGGDYIESVDCLGSMDMLRGIRLVIGASPRNQ